MEEEEGPLSVDDVEDTIGIMVDYADRHSRTVNDHLRAITTADATSTSAWAAAVIVAMQNTDFVARFQCLTPASAADVTALLAPLVVATATAAAAAPSAMVEE